MDGDPGLLIIDDEPGVLGVLALMAKRAGLRAWAASCGAEALELFALHKGEIAFVLSDVRMPGMDGPATVAALRRIAPGVRFGFMSGHLGEYTEEQLRAMGAERVFEKPFAFDLIARELRELATARPAAAA